MSDKEKDLLLKTLSSMLPYGVMLKTDNIFPQKLEGITFDKDTFLVWVSDGGFKLENMECKPYLFPISSMTVEQRCKVQGLLPYKCEISFTNSEIRFYGENYHKIKLEQFEKLFKLFNMWHLDYRGLIPKGLALDATGLNVY